MWVLWGKNLNFLVLFGIAEILGFSEFSVYIESVLLKTFPQQFEFNMPLLQILKKLCITQFQA